MKILSRLFLTILVVTMLLGAGASRALAQDCTGYEERVVTLDNEIAATIGEPQTAGKVPAVVMLHGFASIRDEVGDMYRRLAAQLGERCIGSIRIDFRGWGESGGGMENSTVTGMVEDAAVAYEYLAGLDWVDTSRIGLIGFSLGGRVAAATAGEHPDWFQSMVFWSTGGNISPDFLGQEALDTANAEGVATVDLGWRQVTLGKTFFESLTAFDVDEEFVKYPNDFLVVAGTEDASFEHLNWYLENAHGELRAAYAVEGGDHIYGVLTEDQTMADQVITTTADWFAMTLR